MKKRALLIQGLLGVALLSSTALVQADQYVDAFTAAESGNYHRAASLMTPLANEGNAQAQFNLALMYHGGLGVERNEEEAVRWYHRAARSGSKQAQEFLSVGYQEGWFGLPRDPARARYWEERVHNM